MSQSKIQQKQCANCDYQFGAEVSNFCPSCGQKNMDKNISIFALLYDYITVYLSFDSKLFRSFPALLFNPGFLTQQFAKGKRQTYLKPIRLYLFASLIYFTIFSMVSNHKNWFQPAPKSKPKASVADSTLADIKNTIKSNVNKYESSEKTFINFGKNSIITEKDFLEFREILDEGGEQALLDTLENRDHFLVDNWLFETFTKQSSKIYLSSGNSFFNYFLGSIPLMMFLLMPVLAFIFKILYLFKREYYIKHLVFFFHYHAFTYLLFSIVVLLSSFAWGGVWYLLAFLLMSIYLFKAMRTAYPQHAIWTGIKYFILIIIYPFIVAIFLILTLGADFLLF